MDMPNQGQAAAGPSTSYDLQEELGNGTFGDVYRAVCLRTGKALAIKLVNKAFLRDINAQRRLLKEIQIQRKLTHPNIVALHDCYEDRHHVFLVMDLCSKGELLSLVRRCGRLPEMKVVGLFRQLVEGVTYLHSKSIMHRDIKLANILLDGDGEDIRLKIADFGLAAALDSSDSERTTVCGTPNYLSPEIAFNQPYTYASDLWSLGVALYTMLVGTPPFQGSQVSETIQRVKQGAYSLPDHLTEDARDLINNLLQKDPKMRVPLLEILKHPFLAKCKALPPKPELGPCVSEPSSSVTMKLPSDQPNHTEGQQPRDEPARRQPLDRLVMPPPPPRPREPRQLHASGNSSGKENQPDAVTHHKHGSVGETSKRSKVLGESNGLQRDTWLSHCPSPHPVPQRAKLNPVLPLPTTSSPGWSSEYPSTQQMTSKSAITFGPPEASMSPVRPDVASMGTRPPSQLASSEELQQCATELCRSSLAAAVPTSSSQQRSDPQPSTRQATPYMPSTRRLAPQRHSTSYGHLAILPGGLVEVQHSASGVNITVASDGARLRLQRPGRPDKVCLCRCLAPPCPATFSLSRLTTPDVTPRWSTGPFPPLAAVGVCHQPHAARPTSFLQRRGWFCQSRGLCNPTSGPRLPRGKSCAIRGG